MHYVNISATETAIELEQKPNVAKANESNHHSPEHATSYLGYTTVHNRGKPNIPVTATSSIHHGPKTSVCDAKASEYFYNVAGECTDHL